MSTARDKIEALLATRTTAQLVQMMDDMGDPPPGTDERRAYVWIAEEIEERTEGLTDRIEELVERGDGPYRGTYAELVHQALREMGVEPNIN